MGRVVQLLAKTNQFNLTTRRHDEATIRRQVASGAWRVYTMRVADRFGDFGLTGVAIAEPEAEAWHLESFLMSCRVIGKSVETALLARIAEDARAAGATTLSAEFVDSGRNQVASTFLSHHGFAVGTRGGGSDRSTCRARNGPPGSHRRIASDRSGPRDREERTMTEPARSRHGFANCCPGPRTCRRNQHRRGFFGRHVGRLDLAQPPDADLPARKRVRGGVLQPGDPGVSPPSRRSWRPLAGVSPGCLARAVEPPARLTRCAASESTSPSGPVSAISTQPRSIGSGGPMAVRRRACVVRGATVVSGGHGDRVELQGGGVQGLRRRGRIARFSLRTCGRETVGWAVMRGRS